MPIDREVVEVNNVAVIVRDLLQFYPRCISQVLYSGIACEINLGKYEVSASDSDRQISPLPGRALHAQRTHFQMVYSIVGMA
jgi:hypothetical protein